MRVFVLVALAMQAGACAVPAATLKPSTVQAQPSVARFQMPDANFTWENCEALQRTGQVQMIEAQAANQYEANVARRRAEELAALIAQRCQREIGGWEITRETDRMTDRVRCAAEYKLRAHYPGLRLYAQYLTLFSDDNVLRGYRMRFDDGTVGPWRMASSNEILNGSMRIQGAAFDRIAQSSRLRIETSYIDDRGVYDLDLSNVVAVLTALRSTMCASENEPLDVSSFRPRSSFDVYQP